MTKHQITQLVSEDRKLADRQPTGIEHLRSSFDAEVHLPKEISREFLSASLLWAIDNMVDFRLFHEGDKIVIAHFGGDEIYPPTLPVVRQTMAYRP